MDIALRKDLIEIQEIIANPPPDTRHKREEQQNDHYKSYMVNKKRRSLSNAHRTISPHSPIPIQQLSQLELRYSKLDLDSIANNSHALNRVSQGHLLAKACVDHFGNGGCRRTKRAIVDNARCFPQEITATATATSKSNINNNNNNANQMVRFERELAVDVPIGAEAQREANNGEEEEEDEEKMRRKKKNNKSGQRRGRFQTIGGLFPNSWRSQVTNSKEVIQGKHEPLQEALPDSRPDIVANRRATQPIKLPSSGLIGPGRIEDNNDDVIVEKARELALNVGSKLGGSSRLTRCSRRSVTSRTLPVKRPLKPRRLSLVQLRSLVKRSKHRRQIQLGHIEAPQPEEESGELASGRGQSEDKLSIDGMKKNDNNNINNVKSEICVKGRRFEREKNKCEHNININNNNNSESNNIIIGTSIAQNGSKLVITRPLASLNDRNQLYAIPMKSNKVSILLSIIIELKLSRERKKQVEMY